MVFDGRFFDEKVTISSNFDATVPNRPEGWRPKNSRFSAVSTTSFALFVSLWEPVAIPRTLRHLSSERSWWLTLELHCGRLNSGSQNLRWLSATTETNRCPQGTTSTSFSLCTQDCMKIQGVLTCTPEPHIAFPVPPIFPVFEPHIQILGHSILAPRPFSSPPRELPRLTFPNIKNDAGKTKKSAATLGNG